MATDNKGATGVRSVTMTLKDLQIFTETLQPAQNPQEVHLAVAGSTDVTDPKAPEIGAAAWTANGGEPAYVRALLKFNWSSLPPSAKIVSAKLTLYSNPTPLNGNQVDANFGTSNALLLQRITTNWNTPITWQTQPSATSSKEVLIPHTAESFLDLVNVDVTDLVKGMQQSGNYGFLIKLQDESAYNSRIFCSSKYPDAAKHPKLIVEYTN